MQNYLQMIWKHLTKIDLNSSSSTIVSSAKFFGYVTKNLSVLTSGGPPKNIVPCLPTIMLSSAIAGTYAPPAVQDPITTAIYWENKKHK